MLNFPSKCPVREDYLPYNGDGPYDQYVKDWWEKKSLVDRRVEWLYNELKKLKKICAEHEVEFNFAAVTGVIGVLRDTIKNLSVVHRLPGHEKYLEDTPELIFWRDVAEEKEQAEEMVKQAFAKSVPYLLELAAKAGALSNGGSLEEATKALKQFNHAISQVPDVC